MTEWDYRVLIFNTLHQPELLEWFDGDDSGSQRIEKQLNEMGADGWQLVAFVPARPAGFMWKHPVSGAESFVEANPWLYNVIFKRPAETWEEEQQRVQRERPGETH